MTAADVVKQLESLGTASYKKVILKHGIQEPVFGVKIEELKKIQKRVKKDHQLALDLYETGNYDAQYLAGLIVDDARMTKKDLARWLAKSNCSAICGSIVAWVAAESAHGREVALDWIESKTEKTAHAGWTTLSSLVSITNDADLDMDELKRLLARVEKTIHEQPNLVRYAMNSFVISLGIYVPAFTEAAVRVGHKIGPVTVDMGDTACKVPFAPDYIKKAQKRGSIGKKRGTARC